MQEVPEHIHQVANQARLVLELIDDYRSGAYRELSWFTLALASSAIIYAINPADIVPNFIPVLGTLDDAAVIALVVALIRRDLEKYARFKGYDLNAYFGPGSKKQAPKES